VFLDQGNFTFFPFDGSNAHFCGNEVHIRSPELETHLINFKSGPSIVENQAPSARGLMVA